MLKKSNSDLNSKALVGSPGSKPRFSGDYSNFKNVGSNIIKESDHEEELSSPKIL